MFYLSDQDPYSRTYTYMNNGNFLNVDEPVRDKSIELFGKIKFNLLY
jgi:hypothetical protein